jgi:hypothetical protein
MYVHIACPQILSTITAQWKTFLNRQYHQNFYFPELVTPQSLDYHNFVSFKNSKCLFLTGINDANDKLFASIVDISDTFGDNTFSKSGGC